MNLSFRLIVLLFMLLPALPGRSDYLITVTEDFGSGLSAWTNRDGYAAVDYEATVGNPPGSAQMTYMAGFSPGDDAFHIDENSSGGQFVGNYWEMEEEGTPISWEFDYMARDMAPEVFYFQFGGVVGNITNNYVYTLIDQAPNTQEWYHFEIPLDTTDGWFPFGSDMDVFSNTLANVTYIDIKIDRPSISTDEARYVVDNFSRNISVVPEPNGLFAFGIFAVIVFVRRHKHKRGECG